MAPFLGAGGPARSSEGPWLQALTRGLMVSRWVVSTVVPSVTGPASAFFRLPFTSMMLSSRSTRLLSSTLHSSSISFSCCSRLARAPLSATELRRLQGQRLGRAGPLKGKVLGAW